MKKNLKTAAVLTIKEIDQMTPSGRRTLAKWLKKQADFLVRHSKELAPTWRARYLYND
jgi:phage-related minor tail protein